MGRHLIMFGEDHTTTGLLCKKPSDTSMAANEYVLNEVMNNSTTCYDVMYENAYTQFKIIDGGGAESDQRYIRMSPVQSLFTTRKFFEQLCGNDHRQCGLDNLRVHYWDTRYLYSAFGREWTHPFRKLMKAGTSGIDALFQEFYTDGGSDDDKQNKYISLVEHLCGIHADLTIQDTLNGLYTAEGIDPDQPQVDVFNEMFQKRIRKMSGVSIGDIVTAYARVTIYANTSSDNPPRRHKGMIDDIQLAWTDIYAITRMLITFDSGKTARVRTCERKTTMETIFYYAGDAHTSRVFYTLASIALSKSSSTVSYARGNEECTPTTKTTIPTLTSLKSDEHTEKILNT
jgi:hypothetical protein